MEQYQEINKLKECSNKIQKKTTIAFQARAKICEIK